MAKIKWEQRCVHKERRDFWWRQTSGQFLQRNQCNFHHESKKRTEISTHSCSSLQKKTTQSQSGKNWERDPRSLEEESVWENVSSTVQKTFSTNLHSSILWKIDFSRVSGIQNRTRMQIRRKERFHTSKNLKTVHQKKSQDKSDKSAVTFSKRNKQFGLRLSWRRNARCRSSRPNPFSTKFAQANVGTREEAWKLAKKILKLNQRTLDSPHLRKNSVTFHHPKQSRKKKFVSRASMHQLETVMFARIPITVVTTIREVPKNEKAAVQIKEYILDRKNSRGKSSRDIAWKAPRESRIFVQLDQSKTCLKTNIVHTQMEHEKVRFDRNSGVINDVFHRPARLERRHQYHHGKKIQIQNLFEHPFNVRLQTRKTRRLVGQSN